MGFIAVGAMALGASAATAGGIAAAGIGVAGAVASGIASSNAADAQARSVRNTNDVNLQIAGMNAAMQESANRTNMALAMVARGAPISKSMAEKLGLPSSFVGKSSAVLPYYLADWEEKLGQAAAESATQTQQLYSDLSGNIQDNEQLMQQWTPANEAADQLAKDLSTGKVTDQMLAEAQPTFDARVSLANNRKNAQLEKLSESLNRIDALQSRKGYTGDSFGSQMLKNNASRSIASDAAGEIGTANLQNAMDKAALQQEGRNLRLSNLSLADQRAKAGIDRNTMAVDMAVDRAATGNQQAMGNLAPFNIGPNDFKEVKAANINANQQVVPPTISGTQALMSGISSGANSLSNYLAQRSLQNRANSMSTNATSSYPTGWISPASGSGYSTVPTGTGYNSYTNQSVSPTLASLGGY